jgi:8-oxo-dGTP diphosphatase
VFTATQFEGALIDSPEGNLKWIHDPELTSLPLWGSDPIFFPWLEKPGVFSAKFDYDGEKMLGHSVSFYP